MERRRGCHELDAFLERVGIEPAPISTEQLAAAQQAWRRFGKGNHPAALNFGDCCAYTLAKATDEVLLYKGEDFSRTEVPAVLPLPHGGSDT